jgi:hypothetical protein
MSPFCPFFSQQIQSFFPRLSDDFCSCKSSDLSLEPPAIALQSPNKKEPAAESSEGLKHKHHLVNVEEKDDVQKDKPAPIAQKATESHVEDAEDDAEGDSGMMSASR